MKLETRASDVLGIDEIVQRFRQRFVLLDHCRFGPNHSLTHARVLHASTARAEVYNGLREHPNSVIIFAGEPTDELDGAFLDPTLDAD